MPTVLRLDGFRFYFFSHEPNEPPHVHVDNGAATSRSGSKALRLPPAMAFARTKSVA